MLNILRKNQYDEMLKYYANKFSRLLISNINEQINVFIMYRLSLFEKLIIRRGLKFCLPPNVSCTDILARYEKAHRRKEPLLEENDKEYAQRYDQSP